ncbi:MAG: UDP-N-acetylmuramate:L-alanyl-gamma-D-glutamyl-meso-diaminopimelate ligase [Pseudomonadota bacterium]
MHIHILGICGTFMGGIAALAQQAGHRVTGCDANVYPPMSTQLHALGIEVIEGWEPDQLSLRPDLFVVGNVVSRGNPLMEAILDQRLPFTSGPQWLGEHVLSQRRVIAVAGTHGKTTTTALAVWMLRRSGFDPGFLVGGVVPQLEGSARLGEGEWFVVEADEYDTAFFDKRSKFVHYRPEIAVLNNLEFDHADIFDSLSDIEWQFHQLVRIVPRTGRLVINADDPNLPSVINRGQWTPQLRVSAMGRADSDVSVSTAESGKIVASYDHQSVTTNWLLRGRHNAANVSAALGACISAGATLQGCMASLAEFRGVKRRLEALVQVNGAWVYDDFAHHPTAIRATISALREGNSGRVIVVFEPRSRTMRSGTHGDALVAAFEGADDLLVFSEHDLEWSINSELSAFDGFLQAFSSSSMLADTLLNRVSSGDSVVLMSNGALGGLRERLVGDRAA